MIQVAFHTRVPDLPGYACRLVRKAYRAGSRVTVVAEADALSALDKMLWTFDPVEFLPHGRRLPGVSSASRHLVTPIWLLEPGEESPHHEVLVNMANAVAPGFESFRRVIELVSTEPPVVECGRQRWKHYADRGYAMTHHEAGK